MKWISLLCLWAITSNLQAAEKLKLVAFGDSTTAPRESLVVYAMLLEKELPAVVINAGVAGDNTNGARDRFEHGVLDYMPDWVIIQFGINDSMVDVWMGATTPRVPLVRYKENLRYFVQTLKTHKMKVVLMTPNALAWTDELKKLYGKPPYKPQAAGGLNVLLKDYAAAMRKIAKDEAVPLVDVYNLYENSGKSPNQLLLDGMHPNAKGHRLVADALLKVIQPGRR